MKQLRQLNTFLNMVDNGLNEVQLDANDPGSIKRYMQREIFLHTKDLQKIKEFLGIVPQSQIKIGARNGSEEEDEEDINMITKNASIVEYVKKKMQRVVERLQENANSSKMKLDYLTQESKNQNDFMKEIRISLSSLNQRVEQKASNANVRNIEQQFHEYAKVHSVQVVAEEVETKANAEDLKTLKSEYVQHLLEFQDLKKKFMSTVDVQHKLQNNTQEFSVQMESRFTLIGDEIKRNEIELMNKMNQLKENFVNYQKYIDVRFVEDLNKIQQRVTYEELDVLKLEMQKFATLNGLRELEKKVLPVVNAMCDKVQEFGASNDQMREMIRRFDEVMSDKAAKSQLQQLEYEIDQAYVKKKYWDRLQEEINQTVKEQQATMKIMQESVKNFEINMSQEVDKTVQKGLAKYMANYEKVLGMFQKFFDQEELSKMIDRKADITLVQNIQDVKANRIDVDSCLKLIDTINERLKHLIILQVEITRSMVPQKTPDTYNAEEARNHKVTRREFLLKQAQVTAQWVLDNPLKIIELHNQIVTVDVDLFPQEGESSNYHDLNLAQPAGVGNASSKLLNLNDSIPLPVKQFEKFYQLTQEHAKPPDAPQTIKNWKNQLNQKLQMSQSQNQPLMMHRQTKSINGNSTSNHQTVIYLESQGKPIKGSAFQRKNSDASNTLSMGQQKSMTRGATTYAGGHSPKDINVSMQQSYTDLLNMQKEHFMQILKQNKHDFTGPVSAIFAEHHHRNNGSPLGIEKRFTNDILVDEDLLAQSFSQNLGHSFLPQRNIQTAAAGNPGYRNHKYNLDESSKKISPLSNYRGNPNVTSGNSTVLQSKMLLNRYNGSIQNYTPGTAQGNNLEHNDSFRPFDAQIIINDQRNHGAHLKRQLNNQFSMGINSAGYDVKMKQVVIDSPFDKANLRSNNQQHDSSQTLEQSSNNGTVSKRLQNLQKPNTAHPSSNSRGPVRKLRSSMN